jgi:ankyrin repeat protein
VTIDGPAEGGGLSAIARAVVMNDIDAVRELVLNGHTVGWEPFPFEQTALHFAASADRMLGNTPLSDAVYGGFAEIVDDLLAAGADPMIPGWMNLTALDHASRRNDRDPDECNRRILRSVLKAVKE